MVVSQNRVVKKEVGRFSLYFPNTETIFLERCEVREKAKRKKSVMIPMHLFIYLFVLLTSWKNTVAII